MKLITAIIKPFKHAEVQKQLFALGVHGMTVTHCKGFGRQKGHSELYRGTEYSVEFLPKLKIDIVVDDNVCERAVLEILAAARTGQIGDGKVFVLPLEQADRIQTSDATLDAL